MAWQLRLGSHDAAHSAAIAVEAVQRAGYARRVEARPAGLVGYSLLAKPHRSRYWTLSAWADAGALAAFIGQSPHRDAMTGLGAALPGFQTTRWTVSGGELPPTWQDALARG